LTFVILVAIGVPMSRVAQIGPTCRRPYWTISCRSTADDYLWSTKNY